MANVRAKFKCYIAEHTITGVNYKFMPVVDDGVEENARYHKYTPSGELRLTVDNPAVRFKVGQEYYLDFTTAVEPVAV